MMEHAHASAGGGHVRPSMSTATRSRCLEHLTYDEFQSAFQHHRDVARSIPGASDYFKEKYERLADPSRGARILRLVAHELSVAGVTLKGRVVLDAGCGSGMFATIFALLGAHVEAVDLFPENIAALRALSEAAQLDIRARHADVAALDLPDRCVDFVYCVEAISHFQDPHGFVREAARLMRPGATMFIGDCNNAANPWVVRRTHSFWERSETGPFTADTFPVGENLPFLYRRWMIIRREFPQLRDEDVFQLGMRTAGIGGESLLRVCRDYLLGGRLPTGGYRRGLSQSRPEDAQHNEEPLNPRALARELRELGLDARVRPHFGLNRSRLLPIASAVGAWVPSVALAGAPRFIVIARKPGRA